MSPGSPGSSAGTPCGRSGCCSLPTGAGGPGSATRTRRGKSRRRPTTRPAPCARATRASAGRTRPTPACTGSPTTCPAFQRRPPTRRAATTLYQTRPAWGTAEVVCYHPDHGKTFVDLTDEEARAVVDLWAERYAVLGARPEVDHVLIFENKGSLVGTSNPHPHCQIYAGNMVYGFIAREVDERPAVLPADGAVPGPGGPAARGRRAAGGGRQRQLPGLRALVRALRLRGLHPAPAPGGLPGRPDRRRARRPGPDDPRGRHPL